MKHVSIAIDGPAGAGKSTMARRAAAELHYVYVDTGAIYRTVAYALALRNVSPLDRQAVAATLPLLHISLLWQEDGVQHMLLDDTDVSAEIRKPEISDGASKVAVLAEVRDFLLAMQRDTARHHDVIMDGRDIGTVVLPDADVKIFLSASAEVRAHRRWLELQARGNGDTYEAVLHEILERDERDMNRAVAPLRAAPDAIALDTSELSPEESVQAILNIIRRKLSL